MKINVLSLAINGGYFITSQPKVKWFAGIQEFAMVRDMYYTAIINKIPIELEGSANQWRLYQPDMEKLTYKMGYYSKYMSRDRN